VLRSSQCLIFCDTCDAGVDRCERGWRAYVVTAAVVVACPDCAERYGEDELATSGSD
jgi:hypothetical protein